ncbi:MAG: PAS domain S-box protein [Bradyrhizobium sp.]|uniref:PAS domain S-box protein n=1 Tax=Bradyrhizobium sp. TaxID=376 RepID=UPI001D94A38F|nr:PAS domain S-box protein [Bradyrhizobium sp.]MBV9565411.1 PAS domain S-box protein [Bradyrhizobium sp.]
MMHGQSTLHGVGDPRLAVHAASALPVWLWSTDGSRILWGNPVGARAFGAASAADLAGRSFGPADGHRRQVAQLAGRLWPDGAPRLERLRGFGARAGMLVTCACTRLGFADGSHGVLIVSTQGAGTSMPLLERLQRLVEGLETPVAAFTRDGLFVGASAPAHALFDRFRNLSEADLDTARGKALVSGRLEMPISIGTMVLQRVGAGSDVGLVALITPNAAATAPRQPAAVSVEQTAAADTPKSAADDECAATPSRRHPLRFTWQMDAEGRFLLGESEFTRLIGMRTARGFGRPWHEIVAVYGLDPAGRVLEAIATGNTWSGITVYWPVDDGGRLPVELSGLPVHDHERNFAGYRGFGVCRDIDSLEHLAELRRAEPLGDLTSEPPAFAVIASDSPQVLAAVPPEGAVVIPPAPTDLPASIAEETSPQARLDESVESPENVVPFPSAADGKSPVLTPVENHAFDELARQLSARLDGGDAEAVAPSISTLDTDGPQATPPGTGRPAADRPGWLTQPEPPPRGATRRDRALLDLLPTGILIYRLDRLVYANAAFLSQIGYDNLDALEAAGGLDALYVEPGVSSASSTSEAGTPMRITAETEAAEPASAFDARLFTISWDDEPALALITSPEATEAAPQAAPAVTQPAPIAQPPAAGEVSAEDLASILDTTAEGIVMFDADGRIHACNRSAEALFGYDGAELMTHHLAELFAPESRSAVAEYMESLQGERVTSLLDHGRDVLGRVNGGGLMPLSMTMGRTRAGGPNFFAVFRDISQSKRSESELQQARRLADRAANDKADLLARISHEVRTPLNAILGSSEAMIAERLAGSGNAREVDHVKDIRASGERVIAILNDLTELARIETGRLELAFASQNLNELVESCVTVMQPQANRERIIIRTSLAHTLPPVVADGRALRQITMNLIGTSIHLANPAGQVIVSTAMSDLGEVVLRVRDTGHGLNDNEVAAALEPFRTPQATDEAASSSPVNLSLTKALVEANHAQFHIKTGGRSGTLIEVVFPHALART